MFFKKFITDNFAKLDLLNLQKFQQNNKCIKLFYFYFFVHLLGLKKSTIKWFLLKGLHKN